MSIPDKFSRRRETSRKATSKISVVCLVSAKVLKQAKSCSNEWEERCSETLEDTLMDSPRKASVEEMNKGVYGRRAE